MSYFLFAGLIGISLGIYIFCLEKKIVSGILGYIIAFLLVSLIFTLYARIINVGEIKESLALVISKGVESDNLDEEIEKTIRDEIDHRFFDVSIGIETSSLDKLDIKRINIEAKYPILTKYINEKHNYFFKVLIDKSNMEEFNKDCVEIFEN